MFGDGRHEFGVVLPGNLAVVRHLGEVGDQLLRDLDRSRVGVFRVRDPPEEAQRTLVEGLALKRLGSPDDIADGVLFFVSALAGWVTGQTLSIDGGSHMQ